MDKREYFRLFPNTDRNMFYYKMQIKYENHTQIAAARQRKDMTHEKMDNIWVENMSVDEQKRARVVRQFTMEM